MFRIKTLLTLVLLAVLIAVSMPQAPVMAGGGGSKSPGCLAMMGGMALTGSVFTLSAVFWAGDVITITDASGGPNVTVVFFEIQSTMGTIAYASGLMPVEITSEPIPADKTYTLQVSTNNDDPFTSGTIACSAYGTEPIIPAPVGAVVPKPGPDMIAIPAQAVMGTFLTDTPLYFSPSLDDVTPFTMQAGKSLWVFGLSEDGAFYQVVLAGKKLWVPVNTLGPTAVSPWSSQPLPTTIVS